MANENDLSGKVGLDINDFKSGVAQLNREIKVIETGFKAAAAGTEDWTKDADMLKTRMDSLTQVIDKQQQKVDATRKAYEQVAAEKGETSKAAQDLAIKLNRETEALNKSKSEMNQTANALNNLGNESKTAERKTEDLSKAMDDLGERAKRGAAVAKAAVAAAATAAAAAAVGLFKLTSEAGKNADELITLSNKTGISTQQLQEMEYAARFVDVEVETMTGSMMKLTKNMDMARRGSKEQVEAFKKLGIEYKNQDGSLRSAKEVWADAIGALGGVANEADRDALAMNLFGKSAAELNPLIKAGTDELKRLGDEAKDMGIIMSDEAVKALGQFDDKMQVLDASTKGLGNAIAIAALPLMDSLITTVQNLAQAALENLVPAMENLSVWFQQSLTDGGLRWLLDNKDTIIAGIVGIATGMVAWNVVTMIQGVIAVIKAWQIANTGLSASQKILNLVMAANPIGIVVTAIAALTAGIIYLWNTNEGFRTALTNAWNGIKDSVVGAIQSVKDTVADWIKVGSAIIDGIKEGVVTAAKRLVTAVVNAVKAAWEAAKDFLGISSPSTLFRDQVGLMIGAGLAEGIDRSAGLVTSAMNELDRKMVADAKVQFEAAARAASTEDLRGVSSGRSVTLSPTIIVRSAAEATRELRILERQMAAGVR